MDLTKISSQQTLTRKGHPSNPMGLYNYEKYDADVTWFMTGWASIIIGSISIVKVNNLCTFTINTFANPNTGAVSFLKIESLVYRLPKRFWPTNSTGLIHYSYIGCSLAAPGTVLGSFGIYNNANNVNDPLNGQLLIAQQNATQNCFNDLSGRPLTSSISYETKNILNE